ncbi:MAG TPA: uracil-DNA glycosylase [Stellaceae bacterium]|nr:uracil-DNA glycosylase [Stellaceae bacterium]
MTMKTPERDCLLCPRLGAFRQEQRRTFPDWHNAPVPAFGSKNVRLLVVGLAPGLRGANRTGRPFTGDYAGDLLYATLAKFGFASGTYQKRADDGFTLVDTRVTNAVRCVPPENKPETSEINTCRTFLGEELGALWELKIILALGLIAHRSVLAALKARTRAYPFAHGAFHEIRDGLTLADSYHCSRYNTNTGRLTTEMFESVVAAIRERLPSPASLTGEGGLSLRNAMGGEGAAPREI